MTSIGKNSSPNKRSRQSNDALIYASLLVLFAALVGGSAWYFWSKEKNWNHDYEASLGKHLTSPTAEDVSKLISGNRNRLKTAQRVLEDKMTGRTLTAEEKKEVQAEMDKVANSISDLVKGIDLKGIEEKDPAWLYRIYSQLYEEGKVTVRLRDKTSVNRSLEELKKQEEVQKQWDVSEEEEKEIKEVMNEWITDWYNQARAELIGNEPGKYPLLTECIIPLWNKGKKIEGEPTAEDIKSFKKIHYYNYKENGVKKEGSIDLSKPLEIKFNGCYGFLTEKDKESSSEGKETFGLTKSPGLSYLSEVGIEIDNKTLEPLSTVGPKFHLFKYCPNNIRDIEIGFEKKMFLNRLGYEEWLTKVSDKGSRSFFDICFEEVVETFAHELAHAIVNSIEKDYEGEEGGGHGDFFYEILKKIEKMIKSSPDFKDFKTWWEQPRREQQKWVVDSILVKEKSHWDEWKYWYIGGGIAVLAGGGFLVIIFWDGGRPNKQKNV